MTSMKTHRVLAHGQAADHQVGVVQPEEAACEERPGTRQELPEEKVGQSYRGEPDQGVQQAHVVEVDPADQLPRMAPDGEQERGSRLVIAVAERIEPGLVRVVIRHAHDRRLVRPACAGQS